MKMTVLGNGDSLGTPRVYCGCKVCEEARRTGSNVRLRSSVWIEEQGQEPLLIDCGPDWRRQMEALGVKQVKQALITHAHNDHVSGLPEWADACRWLDDTGTLYAPAEVLNEVRVRYPWTMGRLLEEAVDEGLQYGEWHISAWRVNHGKNGYSYAYRFDHDRTGYAWAYCPDSINLTEEQKTPLAGLSLLVLGTSFYDEPYPMETRSLYDVKEALALLEEMNIPSAIFTHLSHDIDVNRNYGLPDQVCFAETGLVIKFPNP